MVYTSQSSTSSSSISTTTAYLNLNINTNLIGTIINSTITDLIKDTLDDVKTTIDALIISKPGSKSGLIRAKSKVAELAGFYSSSNTLSWDATKVELDKLTFYVMFRLPYKDSGLNTKYTNPLGVSGTSWSVMGNNIRGASGSGLKKLNQAGEQVNSSGVHCDNAGNDISSYSGQNAFDYYIINNRNEPETKVWKDLHYGSAELNQQAVIKAKPIYYLITILTENNPGNYKRAIHFPNNLVGDFDMDNKPNNINDLPKPVYKKRRIKLIDGENQIVQPLTGSTFSIISNKKTVVETLGSTPRTLNVKLYYSGYEDINLERFELENLKIERGVENGQPAVFATYYSPFPGKLRMFEKIATPNLSGLTFGFGFDIGASQPNGYFYEIELDILKLNNVTGDFKLHYGSSLSDSISFNSSNEELKTKILSLLELKEISNYKIIAISAITNSGVSNYTAGWRVKIQRRFVPPPGYINQPNSKSKPKIHRVFRVYEHNIFYYPHDGDFAQNKIKILPEKEWDRWKVRSKAVTIYNKFETKINKIFGPDPAAPNDPLDWLKPSRHHIGFSKSDFIKDIRYAFGIQAGPAATLFYNINDRLMLFQMPDFNTNYPNYYTHIFSVDYFQKAKESIDASLHDRMNLAEKFVMVMIQYQGPMTKGKRKALALESAIRTKSVNKLIEVATNYATNSSNVWRLKSIQYYINLFLPICYRGVNF